MALRSLPWVIVSLILFLQFVESSRDGSPTNHSSHGGAKHSSHRIAQHSSHGAVGQLSHGAATKHLKDGVVVKVDGTRIWRTPLLWKDLKLGAMRNRGYNKSEDERLEEMVLRSWREVHKRKGRTGKKRKTGPLAWTPDLTPMEGTSYYFDIRLGSPPQTFSVDLNTGSDFTWIQCQPCDPCMEQRNAIFDPIKSNSTTVQCSNLMCQDIDSHTCYPGEPRCTYSQAYADGSVTNGEFKSDLINFSDEGTDTTIAINFGCGYAQHDMTSTSGVDGVAGMCRSKASLSSQISPHFGVNVFAHCLVRYNSGSSSTFTIGERPSGIRYTPMVNGGSNSCYYYVNLEAISVGTEKLLLDPSQFQTDPDGNGGTIVDSSSVLTYFPQAVVDAIDKSLTAQVVKLPVKRNYGSLKFPVCFDVSGRNEMNPGLPDLVLAFSGVEMVVKQEEAFVSSDNGNTLCLAVGVARAGRPSFVGSVFMPITMLFMITVTTKWGSLSGTVIPLTRIEINRCR